MFSVVLFKFRNDKKTAEVGIKPEKAHSSLEQTPLQITWKQNNNLLTPKNNGQLNIFLVPTL